MVKRCAVSRVATENTGFTEDVFFALAVERIENHLTQRREAAKDEPESLRLGVRTLLRKGIRVAGNGAVHSLTLVAPDPIGPHRQDAQFSTVIPAIADKSESLDTTTQLGKVRAMAPICMSTC